METTVEIFALLRIGEDLRDTGIIFKFFDFLEKKVITYDWSTDKSKIMLTFGILSDLIAVEQWLQDNVQGVYTASLTVSADIPTDKFAEDNMSYVLFFAPGLARETKQMMMKLFPAKSLIE